MSDEHEMNLTPSKVESMRRNRIKNSYINGTLDLEDDVDDRVRKALMYLEVWKWSKLRLFQCCWNW